MSNLHCILKKLQTVPEIFLKFISRLLLSRVNSRKIASLVSLLHVPKLSQQRMIPEEFQILRLVTATCAELYIWRRGFPVLFCWGDRH